MTDYMPLTSTSPELYNDDDDFGALKPGGRVPDQANNFKHTTLVWLTILIGVMAISAAATFHITALSVTAGLPIRSPHDVTSTLRMVQPSPNLEKGHTNIINWKKQKGPRMIFPRVIVRANAAEPNTVYQAGPSVVLSPLDSMFYHWKIKGAWEKCYISGWVSPHEELIASGKSYAAEGDVTAVEIWNVSSRPDQQSLKAMSWNTRPERLSLMGTVNFTSPDVQDPSLDGQELKWPTPLFDCSGVLELTVEIASIFRRRTCEEANAVHTGFELLELA